MKLSDPFAALDSLARAAAFIVCAHLNTRLKVRTETVEVTFQDRTFTADVYRPFRALAKQGTILVIHGHTAYAQRDTRIIALCERLTLTGCTVVAPCYPQIAAFGTYPPIVDTLEQSMLAILEHADLAPPGGQLAILSASFGALFALMAASRPAMDGRISSLCLIGATYSGEAFATCLHQQDDNHFPRQVLLLNHLEDVLGPRPHVMRALRTALEDNSFARTDPQLPGVLAAIPQDDRALFLRLRDDQPFRIAIAAQFIPWLVEIIPAHLVRAVGLTASVILIHGAEDRVLPAAESIRMHARLHAAGVRTTLEVTSLIAHTTALRLTPALIPAVIRLVRAFAHFFRDAPSRQRG